MREKFTFILSKKTVLFRNNFLFQKIKGGCSRFVFLLTHAKRAFNENTYK